MSAEFARILKEETAILLSDMQQNGFFYCGELRFDPTTWDINNGRCDDFAEAVAARVEGAESVPATDGDVDLAHQVVVWNGKYYDAECHDGVQKLADLPMAKNVGRSRADVIASAQ